MNDDKDFEERKRLYEYTRDQLVSNAKSVAETYDRSLLTLSSAFLGGSLAFVDKVVKLSSATNKWILYAAWISFVVAILLTLGSFVFSLLTTETLRNGARKFYFEKDESAQGIAIWVQRGVLGFTIVQGVSFVIGIGLLSGFVISNVSKETEMTQEKLERSIPPATFEKPILKPQQPPSTPSRRPEHKPQQPSTQSTPKK